VAKISRPPDLECGVAVHRLGGRRAGPRTEPGDRDEQQRLDDDEDADRPPENVLVETVQIGAEI